MKMNNNVYPMIDVRFATVDEELGVHFVPGDLVTLKVISYVGGYPKSSQGIEVFADPTIDKADGLVRRGDVVTVLQRTYGWIYVLTNDCAGYAYENYFRNINDV